MTENKIVQNRIDEAAKKYAKQFEQVGYDDDQIDTIEEAVIFGATFAFQNQWISVEEALPEFEGNLSDYYLIRTDNGWCDVTMYYKTSKKEYWWNFEKVKVTHWMEIPSLEGDEK